MQCALHSALFFPVLYAPTPGPLPLNPGSSGAEMARESDLLRARVRELEDVGRKAENECERLRREVAVLEVHRP